MEVKTSWPSIRLAAAECVHSSGIFVETTTASQKGPVRWLTRHVRVLCLGGDMVCPAQSEPYWKAFSAWASLRLYILSPGLWYSVVINVAVVIG